MELHESPSRRQGLPQAGLERRGLLAALLAGIAGSLGPTDLGAKKKKRKRKKNKRQKKQQGGAGGGYSPDAEERAFLDLINDYRRKHGASALTLNDNLGAAADYHSRDMAKKNYFKHTLKNGDSAEQNIRRFGYTSYVAVGENIAAGYESARDVMKAWQSSPEHDRNMRSNRFTEIGIGRAHKKSSKYGWYWTTTFGDR
ncbi:MAG: CAP domain-containing protein [Thermomicrobiales bacterium]|nr:CAP domain-containing protein [Thermomicrobiales bacterium]